MESYTKVIPVTKSDTTVLPPHRALLVNGAGNLVLDQDGTEVTITGVVAGALLPVIADKVKAATTATNIYALW